MSGRPLIYLDLTRFQDTQQQSPTLSHYLSTYGKVVSVTRLQRFYTRLFPHMLFRYQKINIPYLLVMLVYAIKAKNFLLVSHHCNAHVL